MSEPSTPGWHTACFHHGKTGAGYVRVAHDPPRAFLFPPLVGSSNGSGPDELEFGEANVAEFARTNSIRSAGELNSRLLAHVSAFCGDHFQDDATVVVIAAT